MEQLFSNGQADRPKKQGGLYSLELGKNIGPFLPKDIMPNNPKSIGLLVGTEIVRSHIVMVRSIETTEAKMKKSQDSLRQSLRVQQQGLTCAENLIDFSNYLEVSSEGIQNELVHIRKQAEQLTQDQRRFKLELDQLQQNVNSRNMQNTASISPLLKDLYSRVKQSFSEQKNDMYKLTRELEAVSRQKSILVQQVVMCEGRIRSLESLVGINHQDYDEIDSSVEESEQ